MNLVDADPVGEKRLSRLDSHYLSVRDLFLARQSGTLGLIPAEGSKYAWVRDNVYCSAAIWALALAYRRIDDDKGRTYELEQSAVKCMRGILFCYMRQSHKVERFKALQSYKDSLHCRFLYDTGNASSDDEDYSHLQIDATSLFLLFLSQMTTSGLQIIYTMDEVNFIQNLVYYIERAYRTPDYGMWERGSKDNNNTRELHASSIGMAKAALEVINGLDLFGSQGSASSTIYVDPDAHNRNRMILGSLLPRESSSKETDAGLLAITGYPAFAVDDQELRSKTVERIVDKLEGEYGMKRFLRDGQFTEREDKSRKHYGPAELRQFDGIECEWPFFFIYRMLDGLFYGNKQQADNYKSKIQSLMCGSVSNNLHSVPRYYMVANEKSRSRVPALEHGIFLWGTALYIIACLLSEELVTVGELDPLERHINPMFRTHSVKLHSSLKTARSDVIVQVALIAENSRLQASLAMYGIETQTLTQVEPIHVQPPTNLIELYSKLGINSKLGLSGRPSRPVGALGTSKVYRILGRTVAFYPIILDQTDFYMSHDMSLLLHNIRHMIGFIHENWNMQGRPTVVLLLQENTLKGTHFTETLELMAELKRGECSGARVRLDRLQPMVSASCIEHLDFIVEQDPNLAELFHRDVDTIPLMRHRSRSSIWLSHPPGLFETQVSVDVTSQKETDQTFTEEDAKYWPTESLVERLHSMPSIEGRLMLLKILYFREGGDFRTFEGSVLDEIEKLYREAGDCKQWLEYVANVAVLGRCFSM
jgi:phosphorylase kinase alpha/beta subunit